MSYKSSDDDAWILRTLDEFMRKEEDDWRARSKGFDWLYERAEAVRLASCWLHGASAGRYGRPPRDGGGGQ